VDSFPGLAEIRGVGLHAIPETGFESNYGLLNLKN
jgi:hypothetical protein